MGERVSAITKIIKGIIPRIKEILGGMFRLIIRYKIVKIGSKIHAIVPGNLNNSLISADVPPKNNTIIAGNIVIDKHQKEKTLRKIFKISKEVFIKNEFKFNLLCVLYYYKL